MVANIWLRGFLRFSSKCGGQGLVRTGPLWPLRSPSHPLLRTQIRNCFHPGNVDLAREGLRFQRQAKKVTGKDMIKALSNYIWPKGYITQSIHHLQASIPLITTTVTTYQILVNTNSVFRMIQYCFDFYLYSTFLCGLRLKSWKPVLGSDGRYVGPGFSSDLPRSAGSGLSSGSKVLPRTKDNPILVQFLKLPDLVAEISPRAFFRARYSSSLIGLRFISNVGLGNS